MFDGSTPIIYISPRDRKIMAEHLKDVWRALAKVLDIPIYSFGTRESFSGGVITQDDKENAFSLLDELAVRHLKCEDLERGLEKIGRKELYQSLP